MKKPLIISSLLFILAVMMMAGTASGYYYCAEYVMDYHGHAADLYLSGLDAQGFYDEMYAQLESEIPADG